MSSEPHQPGEREALAAAICRSVHSTRWEHRATAFACSACIDSADAALAHLAARQPARDVEAVAKVLQREFGSFLAHDPHNPEVFWRGAAESVVQQIAALTPTRGVSAETHTEWGVRYVVDSQQGRYGDDGTRVQKVDTERHARTSVRQEIPRSGRGHTLVSRQVTDWREVRDA